MTPLFRKHNLYFAWLLATIGTIVSLYLNIVQGMPVCDLCWYQRICLYPLSMILGIAAYHNDRSIIKYALPLVILNGVFALYQYVLQMMPSLSTVLPTCHSGIPCQAIHFQMMKIITLPFLSLLISLAMALLLILKPASIPISNAAPEMDPSDAIGDHPTYSE